MKRLLMLLMVAACVAHADTWTDPDTGYTWTYQINGDTAEIANVSPKSTGAVTLPSTLGGKPVTSIGYKAFSGCSGLTSVTIPDSVTSIGYGAFEGCSGLTSVTIPNSVTSIGDFAFHGCSGLTGVTIPDSVTSIGDFAFDGCSGLTRVTIPDSVTSIGSCAFRGCSGLTGVTIGNGVTSIGDRAFFDCSGLTSVTIPDSVTSIGDSAFEGCSGLTRVTIPDSVTSIGDSAFEGCSGLTRVTIPDSVTSIGDSAFSGCSGLTRVTIPDSVTSIGGEAFYGCSGLTSVTIPDSVTSIGDLAFSYCSGLTSVTIPDSVTSIGNGAFWGCSGLTGVTIPDSVTTIGDSAFSGCSGLTSVTIPDSVTSIGESAFNGCSGLTRVTIPDSVTSIGMSAFCSCSGLTSVTIPDSVTSIGNDAFELCRNLTSVTIPGMVTRIGESAFSSCSGLTSVTIPDSVTSIGERAFFGCSGLTSVHITDIAKWCAISFGGSYANPLCYAHNLYLNGEKITDLVIPDGVTRIGEMAFLNCSGLTSVTIGNGVTSIGNDAFWACSGLTSVTIPDSVTSIGESAFNGCSESLFDTTTIPGVKLVDGWAVGTTGSLSGNLDLTGVRGIGSFAFRGCSGLTSVTIGNGVTSIGDSAFEGCSGLTSVTIPDSVTSIGVSAFYGCSGLTGVTIPDSVTGIGDYAFAGCRGLTGVTIPDSVTSIGDRVFYNCSGLTEVWLPTSLKTLDCSRLAIDGSTPVFYYDRFTRVRSECLTAEDASETSVELLATNACRVTFSWKCSCEPLRKGKMYDYLSFSIDGEQKDAICGETDWTQRVYRVEGEGEHVLKWTYRKDAGGGAGEDCGWLGVVSVAPPVTLTFLPGGASAGEAPPTMSFYADDGSVTLPSYGTLARPKHAFAGWSDGESTFAPGAPYPCDADVTTLTAAWTRNELAAPAICAPKLFYQGESATVAISAEAGATIRYTMDGSAPTADSLFYAGPFVVTETTTVRAIAVRDDYFDSEEATLTVTKDPTTYGDAVNAPTFAFSPDDGTGWRIVQGESPDGLALRSGAISHNATSRVETVVMGEGVVTFAFKVAGEVVKGDVYDGLAFLIDGVRQGELMGNTEWTTNTCIVAGDGPHTLSWLYVKDESDDETVVGDCAWLDEFKWVSTRSVVVTLDANGGELAEGERTVRSAANEPVGDLPVPAREGWTFLGWFTSADGGERVTAGTVIPNDATLHARWERIFLTVAFDSNGGTCGAGAVSVAYGDPVGTLPVPTRADYVFLGWFTSAAGGERVTAEANITASMCLYAQWRCLFEGTWTLGEDGAWRSGETMDNETNSISMTVKGPGTVSFKWKVSCEDYHVFRTQKMLLDYLSFSVDGAERGLVNGETDWTNCVFAVEGEGEHVLTWSYIKDVEGSEGEDCAWLDGVTWTPSAEGGLAAWLAERGLEANARAANGRTAAECYALGLDPADALDDFRIVSIEMVDDGAEVEWTPKTNRWTGTELNAVVKGAAALDGEWKSVEGASAAEKAAMRFFKVVVEVP